MSDGQIEMMVYDIENGEQARDERRRKKRTTKKRERKTEVFVDDSGILRTGERESAKADAAASVFFMLCLLFSTIGIAALWFSVFNNATLTITVTSFSTTQTESLDGTIQSPMDTVSHFSTVSEIFSNTIDENLTLAFSNLFGLNTGWWIFIGFICIALGFVCLVLMRAFSAKAYIKRDKEIRLASGDKLEKQTRSRCGECPSWMQCFPICYKGVRVGAYMLNQFYIYLIAIVIVWTIVVSVTYGTINVGSKDLSLFGTITQLSPIVRYDINNIPDAASGNYLFTFEQRLLQTWYSVQSETVANNDVGIPIWGLIIIGVGIVIILFVLKHYTAKACCSG